MRNERGLTLVELLAVLAILGIIIALIGTVLINGIKASDRNRTNQQLQQEANYITETIRHQYLEPKEEKIEFTIEGEDENQILKIDGNMISEGYRYDIQPRMLSRDATSNILLTYRKKRPCI